MGPIILSSIESATNSDILQGTRLQTVPAGGVLTFELQSSDNGTSSNFAVSVQMPNGDTPMNNTRIPGTIGSGVGIIDERTNLTVSFPIMQGGHCVFSATETGTAVLAWRVTYTPA
ncbi:MAG: hypothetical protein [Circular genetic element sp.]|jgi:hypothetical protein|nr:MAG: hypothetical protein [Circular genetic element sp.]